MRRIAIVMAVVALVAGLLLIGEMLARTGVARAVGDWILKRGGSNETRLLVLMDGRSIYSPLYAGVYWESQDTFIEDIERLLGETPDSRQTALFSATLPPAIRKLAGQAGPVPGCRLTPGPDPQPAGLPAGGTARWPGARESRGPGAGSR